MRASRNELPILFGEDPAAIRGNDWAGLRSMNVSLPAGADVVGLLKGVAKRPMHLPALGLRLAWADARDLPR